MLKYICMPNVELLKIKHWYKKWWFKLLIAVVFLFFLYGCVYVYFLFNIYRDMKAGTFVDPTAVTKQAPYDMATLVDAMSPVYGNKDAKVTIVEFGDFNCIHTLAEFPIIRGIMEKYKDRVKFYWRNYPVIQENSIDLAKAAVCANKQNKFWQFHDKLFQMAGKVTSDNLPQLAQSVGINVSTWQTCLSNDLTMAQIRKDVSAAGDGEVGGTPTFFINGYKLPGAVDEKTWGIVIDQFLKITK